MVRVLFFNNLESCNRRSMNDRIHAIVELLIISAYDFDESGMSSIAYDAI